MVDNLDTKTLIHVGTELLLIGGLGFWMKGKIGAAEARIEELEKKLAAYEQIFTGLQGALLKHENMLRQMNGVPLLQVSTGNKGEADPKNQPLTSSANLTRPSAAPTPTPPTATPSSKEEDVEEEGFSTEDLDKILKEELGNNGVLEIDTAVVTEKALKSRRKKVSPVKKKVD